MNTAVKTPFNFNLEALRGFAALVVILHHVCYYTQYLDPYFTPKYLVSISPPGHLSVLVFFVLSGYVIGISNKKPMNSGELLPYLKKRVVRIYPLYFVSLIVALLIATEKYSLFTIVTNFTLLHVLLSPPILENGPIWSIHFEMLFYLLFMLLSYFRWNEILVLIASLTIAITTFYFHTNEYMPLLSSYLFGFSFWLAGLILARRFGDRPGVINYSKLLGALFFMLSLLALIGSNNFMDKLSSLILGQTLSYPEGTPWARQMLGYSDLAFLPYCFLLVLLFANKKIRYEKVIVVLIQVPILFSIFIFIYNFFILNNRVNSGWIVLGVFYYAIACLFFFTNVNTFERLGRSVIKWLIPIGSISYGIYIIHLPILFMVGEIPGIIGTGLTSYLFRVFIFLFFTIVVSYVLEKYFQPWARKQLYRK
jgi:peptidoglycan/LPS O-acetylase OafA/YrhL